MLTWLKEINKNAFAHDADAYKVYTVNLNNSMKYESIAF